MMYFMNLLQIKFVMMKTSKAMEIVLVIIMVREDSQQQFRNNLHNSHHMTINYNVISREMEINQIFYQYFLFYNILQWVLVE